MERNFLFNQEWKFYLGEEIEGAYKEFDDSKWRRLDLPHDWSIELDFDAQSAGGGGSGFLNGGMGWYRKRFVLPAEIKDKRIWIEFGGVYMDSSVYANGQFVGNYPNGYTPFAYDITEHLIADGITENVIAVKVVNQQPSSRWYSGSGIYRSVRLIVTHPIHVERYGTYVTTPDLEQEYARGAVKVHIQTVIKNDSVSEEQVSVKSTLYDETGHQVAETLISDRDQIGAGKGARYRQKVRLTQPILWEPTHPYRYRLQTEVMVDGTVVDCYETWFGLRWFAFDAQKGFSLNGKAMKLKGVCMHHDQGALGAAAHYRAIERQMEIMQSMGVNAIRVTHNPAADELLEICNKMGLLVIEEAFDVWETSKRQYDYARYFNQPATHPQAEPGMTWAEFDIKQMVARGKNEPCIIMWSLGNEIVEASVETATKLHQWVKAVDLTRPTTQGHNAFIWGFSPESKDAQVANVVDVVGFNYGEGMYDKAHTCFPEWKMMGSENSSATRSRGEYAHPYEEKVDDNHADLHQSSYDNDRMGWGRTVQDAWKEDRKREYIAGEFIWTGFDYIGEPSPYYNLWPAKSSYFGAVDTAGFPKDAFYMYQSQWFSASEYPMVHILPHWNWEGDDRIMIDGKIPVHVYSNAAKVELFLNNQSLTEKSFVQYEKNGIAYQESVENNIYLEWLVPYETGELKAVAKDSQGTVIATQTIQTAGVAAGMVLTTDRSIIQSDGKDLAYVTVDIVDEKGHFVPQADQLIHFELEGPGQIVGVDNGNPIAADERYKDIQRKAFNGKALVIIQSTHETGRVTVKAVAEGLQEASITLETIKQEEAKQVKKWSYVLGQSDEYK